MVKNKKLLVLMTLLLALFITSGATLAAPHTTISSQQEQEEGTVLDVLKNDDRFETILALVEAGALADNLELVGPITFFAPTDEAFTAFEAMEEEPQANLTEILLYHVVNGRYNTTQLRNHDSLTTWLGAHLAISGDSNTVMLDDNVQITGAGIEASNGIVYVIDAVLIPELEEEAGATETATATAQPDEDEAATGTATTTAGDEGGVLNFLAEDGRFGTLIALLESTDLSSQMEDMNDMTLFAPTDEAFATLPQERIDQLLADTSEDGELSHILLYHIVSDSLNTNQIATDDLIPTLDGRPIFVDLDEEGAILLNNQRIIQPNIQTANGIIHVIDGVLIP